MKRILINEILKEILDEVSLDQVKAKYVGDGENQLSEKDYEEALKAAASKTVFVVWLVKRVFEGKIMAEDIYKYKEYFQIFSRHKNKYPKKDINQYKSSQDIDDFIKTTTSIKKEVEADPSKDKGVTKTEKFARLKIGEVDGFSVYEIPKGAHKSKEMYNASCELGSGTEWCTATGNTNRYYSSYTQKGPLYIFINNSNPKEKYQFHYESNSFMDADDRPVI